MSELKIKAESLPERCEICHQSDQFNSQTGYCSRCNNVLPALKYETKANNFLYYKEQGIWRDNSTLVMHKYASLPDRCIKCNAPANGMRIRRKLSWHPSAYYLLLLINVIIFVVVASIVRKRATIEVGLCEHHYSKRRRDLKISWSMAIGGVMLFFLGASDLIPEAGILIGLILVLTAIIYGAITAPVVKPSRIDDRFICLKNVNSDYLSEFPPLY